MKQFTKISMVIVGLMVLSGCATKHYGRLSTLSTYEKDIMNCREIALEVARAREFISDVNIESQFDGKDFLAAVTDFTIGNSWEKGKALESGNKRLDALRALARGKDCSDDPS